MAGPDSGRLFDWKTVGTFLGVYVTTLRSVDKDSVARRPGDSISELARARLTTKLAKTANTIPPPAKITFDCGLFCGWCRRESGSLGILGINRRGMGSARAVSQLIFDVLATGITHGAAAEPPLHFFLFQTATTLRPHAIPATWGWRA